MRKEFLSDSRIRKAFDFASIAHTGQTRFTGEPYINHSVEVAEILFSWNADRDSIIAGLLHDTIDDGAATKEDLTQEFGSNIALLVEGVSSVARLRLKKETNEYFLENLRKMILFMAQDIRVVLIKLADRLHNMRTLKAVKSEKRKRIAIETIEIYAPLAERLGMGKVKGELEDLAFPFIYPDEYERVKSISKKQYKKAEKELFRMKRHILYALAKEGIKAQINGRQKRLYSLWKKLERPEIDWDFEKIHDVVAFRILVDSVTHCYTALGSIHTVYKPVPYIGVSDFIAQPKPNGYQSIHTKVFGPSKTIVEVQIRTHAMHEQAEFGVAAHWAYSEAKSKGVTGEKLEKTGVKVENKLSWVKELVEWQKEITDSEEFLKAVKFDAFNQRNFIFSPKGDVYDLPKDATPVDFAFAVHTKLGHFIAGAKVNGKIVPLSFKLKSGDVVEILKAKTMRKPNHDWLNFVVTTAARSEILKTERRL